MLNSDKFRQKRPSAIEDVCVCEYTLLADVLGKRKGPVRYREMEKTKGHMGTPDLLLLLVPSATARRSGRKKEVKREGGCSAG